MEKYRFFPILVAVCLVVALVIPGSLVVSAQEPTEESTTVEPTEEPTVEPTEEPTVEPTEEPTAEPTEEPTAEPTEEPTEEPTAEPTEEPTEEPTAEPTEEPTAEPTEEPTAEPTEEPTEEPTAEPTEEPTEEPTAEPTEEPTAEPTEEPTATPAVGTTGVGAQQTYGGSWTSYVAVQNIGTASTNVNIDWYLSGATDPCSTSAYSGLQSGRATRFTPPAGDCGNNWVGSAVVSGEEPLVAVAETLGSQGQLLSGYMGSSEPTTEALIIPLLNNSSWHSLVGISNAGSATANVRVSLVSEDGSTFDSRDVSIPSGSATHLNINTDFLATYWRGSVRIENIGTPQPLYATVKAERYTGPPNPVSIAYEGIPESAGSSEHWMFPVVHKRTTDGSTANGQNQTLAFVNPDGSNPTTVTVHWLNRDGSEVGTTVVNLDPNGTQYITTRDTPLLGVSWSGLVKADTTPGRPVVALGQPWVQDPYIGYTGWAAYNPIDISGTAGSNTAYVSAVHKQSSGGVRSGMGWCTSVIVNNMDETGTTTVRVEIYNETGGTLAYTEDRSIAGNGQEVWYTLQSYLDGMGSDFFGGAKITVLSGGPIIAMGQGSNSAYGASDGYSFYNGVNQ